MVKLREDEVKHVEMMSNSGVATAVDVAEARAKLADVRIKLTEREGAVGRSGKGEILDRLAVGGMAELFKATLTGDHGFEKLVAIKKILPHLATDKSFVEMFIDEARITAQLDHRHIVSVFELGTDADTPYIAMQFVDGLDVLALLRECARAQIRLPPDLAASLTQRVAALWNLYGPTETAVDATYHVCEPHTGPSEPIGRPVANARAYVLDASLEPMPEGGPGELYLGEGTVKTHVVRILAKLGLRDRVHVVVFAYENGVVRPGRS